MRQQMRNAENAQSEVIGYSLLIGVLVTAVGIVIVLAAPIIQESKNDAYLKNVEQGFTVLDSKVSMVGLGNSPSQLVQIYTQAGDIVIDDDTYNHLSVNLINGSTQYELYNSSMGTVEYTLGLDKVAYEGGGTFRKYPGDDNAVMISPPEFHYNGETLTLPIIRINSNESIGGRGVVNLYFESNNIPNVLFPNPDVNPEFSNPLLLGKQVNVVIKSDYYREWAEYIEERTEASALTNDDEKEVTVILNSKPSDLTQVLDYPIDVYGFNTENESALNNFTFSLNATEEGFSQFHLTLQTDTDPPFIIDMEKSGGLGPGGVTVFFIYGNFPLQEKWKTNVTWLYYDGKWDFNFIDTFDTVEYIANDDSWTWNDEDVPYNKTYTKSTTTDLPTVKKVVQHYMQEVGPTFSFEDVTLSGSEKGYSLENSTFVLYYEVAPPRITYLHVVEHKIQANVA